MSNVSKNKILLVGWDAADWKVIDQLMNAGQMPALKGLMERGASGNLRTLQPPLSPMLWTSIATGKRPHKHGIYGFTEPTFDGKAIQPMTNLSRKSKAVWNILNQNSYRSLVVGWWPSHPAEPINGVMVSDLFHKSPKKPGDNWTLPSASVHPSERQKDLDELRVHPTEIRADDIFAFAPHAKEVDQEKDSRLSSLMKITAECSTVHNTATHLLETEEWDFAAIYYDAIDHYSHAFMRYRAPQQAHISDSDHRIYRDVVDMGYRLHDMMLQQLLTYTDDQTHVLIVSDHGFHSDHLRPVHLPVEAAGPAAEHRDYGIIVAAGPRIKAGSVVNGANLLDITPTLLELAELPSGSDMDGKVLTDLFKDPISTNEIATWESVSGETGQHASSTTLTEVDSEAMLEQLEALGYINRPKEGSRVEVEDCQLELKVNLARAYMDAQLHGEAAPILFEIYQTSLSDFRVGHLLATCFIALKQTDNLSALLHDMNERTKKYAEIARKRLEELDPVKKERSRFLERAEEVAQQEKIDSSSTDDEWKPPGHQGIFDQREKWQIQLFEAFAAGDRSKLRYFQASLLTMQGKPEEAIALLKTSQHTAQDHISFFYLLSQAYLDSGEFKHAEATLLQGLEIDPQNPACFIALARCYVKQKLPQDAIKVANRAIKLQYYFPTAHFYLGRAQEMLGDYSAAIESMEMAIEQNPNFKEAFKSMERIHKKAGTVSDAAANWKELRQQFLENQSPEIKAIEKYEFKTFSTDELDVHLESFAQQNDKNSKFVSALWRGIPEPGDKENGEEPVIVVSGLPRTGTSMMMQMLQAGGLTAVTDGKRVPDESNPRGYFESELVKDIQTHNKWVFDCGGRVLKVVSPLLPYLPSRLHYKIIYMQRPMQQVLSSQTQMLKKMKRQTGKSSELLAEKYNQQERYADWLLKVQEIPTLKLDYAEVLADPAKASASLETFLGQSLDRVAMVEQVKPDLHREKQE